MGQNKPESVERILPRSVTWPPSTQSGNQMPQPSPLTVQDLAEIKKRCDLATERPWKSYVEGRDHTSGSNFIMTGSDDIYLSGASIADQDFIAEARQDIPKLIAEVQRLTKLLSK